MYGNENWRRIDHAVEANRSLRSFGIDCYYSMTPPPASFIEHLCMNETLKNINCNTSLHQEKSYYGESRANHSMCICFNFSFKNN